MSFGGDRALSTPILVMTKRLALRDEIFERHSFFSSVPFFTHSRAGPFFLTPRPFVQLFADLQPADTWALHSQHQRGEMDMHTESSKPSRHAVDMLLISWW